MKLLQQVKQFSVFILPVFVSYHSLAQTKLLINGARINMANAVYLSTNDVSISGNGLVNVDRSTIKIAGSTTSAGAIDVRNGTAELNGSSAQQLAAASFAAKTAKALTVNNTSGATVNDTLNITDVLTVSSGNLISQGFLTLKSNDSNTARVAPVTSVAPVPISGDVIVERFITAKRAFRFLTAPVNATTTIRDNWMEGVYNPNTTSGNINPVPNFGTHITGRGGHLNRFDETITNNPSLFTYNSQAQSWAAATNSDTLIRAGQAFSMMVRGSRSTNLNSNTATPSITTLRAKGALVTGTVVLTASGGGGTPGMPALSTTLNAYTFIANPYASPVDWFLINTLDIANTIYIFDPTISGSNGRGAYVSFNRTYPGGGKSNDTSKIDNNIQSGQSFFVQTTGPNPSLTFKEVYKSNLNRRVFRQPNKISKISMQLLLPSQQINGGAADALVAFFSKDFSPSLGNEDSYKFTNQDENIAILRNGKTLSIEGRKPVTANDTLPLKMWQLSSKNYILKIALKNFADNVDGYLEDAFLHTSTRLTEGSPNMIPFAITADSSSVAAERFRIVFKTSGNLLSQETDIDAYVKNEGIQVDWTLGQENNTDSCIVEKSVNARKFAASGAVKVKGAAGAASAYNWFDANPVNGDNFYRIKFIDLSGESKYSRIAKVHFAKLKGVISVVANAGNSNSLTINFKNIEKGKYAVGLVNNAGQKVYSSSIYHDGGSANYSIKPKNLLAAGIYHVQVLGENTSENIAVLIQ